MDILDFFWTFYLNHLSPLWGYFIRTTKGNVTSMSGLRQVVKSGELLEENK